MTRPPMKRVALKMNREQRQRHVDLMMHGNPGSLFQTGTSLPLNMTCKNEFVECIYLMFNVLIERRDKSQDPQVILNRYNELIFSSLEQSLSNHSVFQNCD